MKKPFSHFVQGSNVSKFQIKSLFASLFIHKPLERVRIEKWKLELPGKGSQEGCFRVSLLS